MEHTSAKRARIWYVAVPLALFAGWRAYLIASASPEAKPSGILRTIVALAVTIGIATYYFRTGKQLSQLTLLLIAAVIIILAVLTRRI